MPMTHAVWSRTQRRSRSGSIDRQAVHEPPHRGRNAMGRQRWMLGCAVLVGILIGLAGPAGAQQKIVIYAAQDEKTTNEMTRMFTEETKIGTEVIRVAAAGTLATRIRAEKAAPKADVFMGGSVEFHEPLATDGLVLPYRSPVVAQAKIDPAYVSPSNFWH